jgi:hypothetical protein
MTHDSVNEKQQAHELIDRLPPTQLTAVVGWLEAMLDPASAPEEEEEITPETVAKYMVRHRKPPSQSWRTILEYHM